MAAAFVTFAVACSPILLSGTASLELLIITPKAFANLSPGLSRSAQPWGSIKNNFPTLKGFVLRGTLSGFNDSLFFTPRVVAVLQPRAEISERLRRSHKSPLVFGPTKKLARFAYRQ
jgi:hypothetical protein